MAPRPRAEHKIGDRVPPDRSGDESMQLRRHRVRIQLPGPV
jgi:hypothetical protein